MDECNRDDDIRDFGAEEQSDGSYVDRDGCITWYNKHGEWHKEDGPGVIYDGGGEIDWFLNGVNYTFDEWIKLTPISDEQKMLFRLRYV
tara:strand:- start:650 stop:916 length:267 start_codon:yes stop_codon:yes gene_type:complete